MTKRTKKPKPKVEAKPMSSIMDQVASRVATEDPKKEQPDLQPAKAEKPSLVESADVRLHRINVPMQDIDVPKFRMHLDINIQGPQATTLRQVVFALDSNKETLANGRRCVTANDAIRWLLEKLAKETENP